MINRRLIRLANEVTDLLLIDYREFDYVMGYVNALIRVANYRTRRKLYIIRQKNIEYYDSLYLKAMTSEEVEEMITEWV